MARQKKVVEGNSPMTPRERAVAALTLKQPDYVPTFELEFQLVDKMFGREFLHQGDLKGKTKREREKLIKQNAEYMIEVYSALDYSIIPVHYLDMEGLKATVRHIRKLTGDHFMLTTHGDGTFSIPDGNHMLEFVYWITDKPADAKRQAAKQARETVLRNKEFIDVGMDCFILCSDYCFNTGPFLSPDLFAEFVVSPSSWHPICAGSSGRRARRVGSPSSTPTATSCRSSTSWSTASRTRCTRSIQWPASTSAK
jgi:uroporphyrinogen decarboxylase